MKLSRLIQNPRGSVFLTTMICVFLMSLTGGYLYQVSAGSSHFMNRMQKSTQAQMLADAGLARALSTIRGNWATVSAAGNFPLTTLGPGTYDAAYQAVGGRHLVTCTGSVLGVQRMASAEILPPSISALDYVFAGGSLSAHVIDPGTGQATGTITGDIYAGGPLTLDGPAGGNTLNLTGDIFGASTITTSGSVNLTGSSSPNWSTTVNFPTVDFSIYQAIATANGTYYNGNQVFASGALPAAPTGGVIYVNGDVTIRGTQNVTAAIIATGNITISKSGSTYPRVTVNQYSTYPALMTQNGNITFTSTGNGGAYMIVTGLIYSGNNFTVDTGNHDDVTVTGSILAKGTIDLDGMTAWNDLNASYVAQSPPGFSNPGNANMTIRSYNR